VLQIPSVIGVQRFRLLLQLWFWVSHYHPECCDAFAGVCMCLLMPSSTMCVCW
jgi:hypothetical protein